MTLRESSRIRRNLQESRQICQKMSRISERIPETMLKKHRRGTKKKWGRIPVERSSIPEESHQETPRNQTPKPNGFAARRELKTQNRILELEFLQQFTQRLSLSLIQYEFTFTVSIPDLLSIRI